MKKVLILGLLLVVAVSAISAISAVSASEGVTVDGIHFKIVDGYKAVEKDIDSSKPTDTEDIDGTAVDSKVTSEYKDSSGTVVLSTVCLRACGGNYGKYITPDNKCVETCDPSSNLENDEDSSGNEIEIEVGSRNNKKIDLINPGKGEKKSIAGKEGFLIKDTDDGKTKYKFEFLQDGKIIKITAPSEDIINQVLS